jgi:hypothetical protein
MVNLSFSGGKQRRVTFSNFSFMGRGFMDVIVLAISSPISNASSFDLPGRYTNKLSVSP